MKKRTKKIIRNVGIGAGVVAALGATAYVIKDNKEVKKVVSKIKKEVVNDVKIIKKKAKAEFKKIIVKNAKK